MQGTAGRPLPPDTGALHALYVLVMASVPRVGGDWPKQRDTQQPGLSPQQGTPTAVLCPVEHQPCLQRSPGLGSGSAAGGKI